MNPRLSFGSGKPGVVLDKRNRGKKSTAEEEVLGLGKQVETPEERENGVICDTQA